MNIFNKIKDDILSAIEELVTQNVLPEGLPTNGVTVELPRDPLHGDLATNAAMVLAKPAKMKPRDIAQSLGDILVGNPNIASMTVAGPGFLNINLAPEVWHDVVGHVIEASQEYGRSNIGENRRVNVEYVSANPTGPLHVGHTRGAVFGDALAGLLDFAGFDVTREYYINDGGAQVDTLARSVYLRYLEAHGHDVEFPAGTYPGDYLIPVGAALKEKVGDAYLNQDESTWLEDIREFATAQMMDLIRSDLAAIGVKMDVFFSEKSLYGSGRIEQAIDRLKVLDLIYRGTLEPPKGKLPEDWEPREQTLFRSTAHGDDVDRPIMKSDGSWTYFAPDIAYHYDKVERGFDALINVFGADHSGYVKRMKAAVSGLTNDGVTLDIKLTQLVKLFKNGEPFKMSKRAGTFVTLRDVVDEVGPDVTRFVMLTRKNDAPLDFDFDKVLEQSRDNPVFYVQYAHARVCSIHRKAREAGIFDDVAQFKDADLSHLNHDAELRLIRKISEWPRMVEAAASANEPHRIAFYLNDLASDFHSLWTLGREVESVRFLQQDSGVSLAKIALAESARITLWVGLKILGVTPMEEMR